MKGRGGTLTDAIAVRVEYAYFLAVHHLEELLDLVLLGRLIVILLRDRRVGRRVDFALVECLGHSDGGCGRERLGRSVCKFQVLYG